MNVLFWIVIQVMASVTRSLGSASVRHSGCKISSQNTLEVVTQTVVSLILRGSLLWIAVSWWIGLEKWTHTQWYYNKNNITIHRSIYLQGPITNSTPYKTCSRELLHPSPQLPVPQKLLQGTFPYSTLSTSYPHIWMEYPDTALHGSYIVYQHGKTNSN